MTEPQTDRSLRRQLSVFLGLGAPKPPGVPARLDLSPGERIVWTRSLTSRWPALIATVILAVGVVLAVLGIGVGFVPIVVSAVVLIFSRIRVQVDPDHVAVLFGGLSWPRKRFAVADIDTAGVIDLRPTEWGGWGYRIAAPAKGFSRTAVVLRAGPALHLKLASSREFAVTIDEPDQGAALINAYIHRDGREK